MKYDCILPGNTTYSDDLDSDWYHGFQHMYVYLRKSTSMTLPVPQPQTTAYSSASYLERANQERSEIVEAKASTQGLIMPPRSCALATRFRRLTCSTHVCIKYCLCDIPGSFLG